MTDSFETWAMRALVVGLLGIILAMVWSRWNKQDAKEGEIDKKFLEFHKDSNEAIQRSEARLIDSLNRLGEATEGIKEVFAEFKTLVAKEYATREELKQEIDRCSRQCPYRGGDN